MSAFDDDAAEEWLGEEVDLGGGRTLGLSDDTQAVLLQGFKDDVWTEDDVVPEGSVFTKDDLEVWKAVVTDCEVKQTKTLLNSEKTRTWRWLKGRGLKDGMNEDEVKIYTPSKQCLKDMEEQGVASYVEILYVECSFFLGRSAGKGDLQGAEYGCPPGRSQGGIDARKQKANTFDTELDRAIERDSAKALGAFVLKGTQLMADGDHLSGAKMSAVVNGWWMTTQMTYDKHPTADWLAYIQAYRLKYMGRGFPCKFDTAIFAQVSGQGGRSDALGGASRAGDKMSLFDQMEKLTKSQMDMAQLVSTLSTRMGSLAAQMDGGGGRVGATELICHFCKQKGHLKRDCAKYAEEQAKKQA